MKQAKIAVLGAGNIGTSIAKGLVESGQYRLDEIILTRRDRRHLSSLEEQGFQVTDNNREAVTHSVIEIVCVEPQQIDNLLEEIQSDLNPDRHTVISVVSGVSIRQIRSKIGKDVSVVRAMPNTAIACRESMTCIASENKDGRGVEVARNVFDTVGKTLEIDEEQVNAATALGACGIAFFLRAIRAASQGGIEIGFHAHDALLIASQTAKGASSLLLGSQHHPEYEIDKVTTPRGCTIGGLNQMEHEGFSSAMIKGIITSATIAGNLYTTK